MQRHFFISEDLALMEAAEADLEDAGLCREQIHVLAADDDEGTRRSVHEVQSLMRKDIMHAGEIGALIGLIASLAVLAVIYLTGIGERFGWLPFVFLAIILFGFFTWQGGLLGIQQPNSRFRQFSDALEHGKSVMFVDLEDNEKSVFEIVMGRYPGLAPAGTGRSSPRLLVRLHHGIRRFLEAMP